MSSLKRVLILGTGPASIQLAVTLKRNLGSFTGIAGRESSRSESFYSALKQSDRKVFVDIQNDNHMQMQGECEIDQIFRGYGTVRGKWNTLIMTVTADAYVQVLKQIEVEYLREVECIVLLSPTFGSNSLVRHYCKHNQLSMEIISLSTYLGATRWSGVHPSNRVVTTAVKKKVYVGSNHGESSMVNRLQELYSQLGTNLQAMNSPMEAESRNISLYVHPPLFMNEFTLNAVFGEGRTKKYVYKLFPEGPITQELIRNMLEAWKEMMRILESLHVERINLLQFMTDDNYPIRSESISRDDIENFVQLESIHQQYLLYVRYASLLIDPFSEPDQNGKYFDFSAVPIRQVFIDRQGYWDIPRMPKEDFYRLKIIQGVARHLNVSCPTIDRFLSNYEEKIQVFSQTHHGEKFSEAFTHQTFVEDLKMICSEIPRDIRPGRDGR